MQTHMLKMTAYHAVATAVLAVTFTSACTPAAKVPAIPSTQSQPSLKPDANASSDVALTIATELSHVERALQPFIGTAAGFPAEDCRQTVISTRALREVRWRCGMADGDIGTDGMRHEVEGVERVVYDQTNLLLNYSGSFETRNYSALTPRSAAHTLITTRKIKIAFTADEAKITLNSLAAVKNASSALGGSNWTTSLVGTLRRSGTAWSLDAGTVLGFSGALFGLDDRRETILAAGDYRFVSDSVTKLTGLDAPGGCTKPESSWLLTASGGGNNFDTTVRTTSAGIRVSGTGPIDWPTNLCDRP